MQAPVPAYLAPFHAIAALHRRSVACARQSAPAGGVDDPDDDRGVGLDAVSESRREPHVLACRGAAKYGSRGWPRQRRHSPPTSCPASGATGRLSACTVLSSSIGDSRPPRGHPITAGGSVDKPPGHGGNTIAPERFSGRLQMRKAPDKCSARGAGRCATGRFGDVASPRHRSPPRGRSHTSPCNVPESPAIRPGACCSRRPRRLSSRSTTRRVLAGLLSALLIYCTSMTNIIISHH